MLETKRKKVLQIRVLRYSLFRPITKGFLCQARIMRNTNRVFKKKKKIVDPVKTLLNVL